MTSKEQNVEVYPSVTTGKKDGTILLTCLYSERPYSITSVYWVFNDGKLPFNAHSDEASNRSLTIRPFRPSNAGKYSCIVDTDDPEALGKGDAVVQYGKCNIYLPVRKNDRQKSGEVPMSQEKK